MLLAEVMSMYSMRQRLAAELFGTFWLVLGGCGTAVLAGNVVGNSWRGPGLRADRPHDGLRRRATSRWPLQPGRSRSGSPTGRRFDWREVPAYVVTQIVGAILAAAVLLVIASGIDGFDASDGFATNGYGDHSPGGYSLLAVLVCEVVLTAFFLYVILGVTDTRAPKGFAPLAIGLALTLIHLVSIPVSNTSVNPARSIGPALFAGGDALAQLWVFLVAPIVGALIAGATYAGLFGGAVGAAPLEVTTEG